MAKARGGSRRKRRLGARRGLRQSIAERREGGRGARRPLGLGL